MFKQKVFVDDVVNKSCLDKPKLRVLFEQKSPYYRKPLHKGVPDHYIGQIKLGLSVFPVCDIALFSDSLFRVCTYRQFATKTYN